MAYASKELATALRERVKPINKKFGMKTSVSRDNGRLTLRVISGKLELPEQYSANPYYTLDNSKGDWICARQTASVFTPEQTDYLNELREALMHDHWDKSDIMSDYFSCAFYPYLEIGRWDKVYICTK